MPTQVLKNIISNGTSNVKRRNYAMLINFFVDALSFVISRSNKGYISSKIFSKSKKKLFYIGKNISVIQSLSVSQFVFFKFNGDSNLFQDQIGKNIFEIGLKYFRSSKPVDRSIPDPDFQEDLPKNGENSVVEDLCLDIGSELLHL